MYNHEAFGLGSLDLLFNKNYLGRRDIQPWTIEFGLKKCSESNQPNL